jgi:hypothetical protein
MGRALSEMGVEECRPAIAYGAPVSRGIRVVALRRRAASRSRKRGAHEGTLLTGGTDAYVDARETEEKVTPVVGKHVTGSDTCAGRRRGESIWRARSSRVVAWLGA